MNVGHKISAVIPAYNAEKTIAGTLESVLNQTCPVDEVIVVDDGSSDATVEIVSDYAPSVRLICQKNAGPAAARNRGASAAKGDWIALLDADDSWLPQKIERQVAEIADDVSIIHTHTVGDKGKNDHDLNFDELWIHNAIGTSTVLLNKSVFEAVGGFNEDRNLIGVEDYNLWLRMAATGKRIVTIREELTRYTPADGNLSSQIPQVVRAELHNIEFCVESFQIPQHQANFKRAAILEEYARALFWMRDLPLARKYYRELLRYQCNGKNIGYWLATWLPPALLNAKRKEGPTKNETLLQAANVVVSR